MRSQLNWLPLQTAYQRSKRCERAIATKPSRKVTMTKSHKYLHFVNYSTLTLWDIKRYFMTQVSSSYTIVKLGDYIQDENEKYKISDSTKTYGILGVNNQTGIFDAYLGNGSKIKQKYKKMQVGWIAYNPYRINVGSIGMRSDQQEYEYISPAYVVFSCRNGLLPEYLYRLMKTDLFNKIIRENTTGSVRQNLNYSVLSNLQIPLPSLKEQNKIIAAYNDALVKADRYVKQSQNIDKQIEAYIYEKLGIKVFNETNELLKEEMGNEAYTYLRFYSIKEMLDRWDVYNTSDSIFDRLKRSEYPIKMLGDVYGFITRRWKKEGEDFNYVELGNVSPREGIVGKQTLKVKNAPSRATQTMLKDDLIIGTTRPYLKRFAMVNEDYAGDVCSSGFQVIESRCTYNIRFLYEYLLTSLAIDQFEYYMTGALYPAITSKDLRKVKIPLPPLDIQNEIVAHITALRDEQMNLQQQAFELRQQAQQQFEQTIFN